MTTRPFRLAAACVLLVLATTTRAQAPSQPGCAEDALTDPALSMPQRAACARAIATHPPAADTGDVDALYRALSVLDLASSTRPSTANLEAARTIVAELTTRRALRPADRRAWQRVLLASGRADEARADEAAHPGRLGPALPNLVPLRSPAAAGEARYWQWDADGNVLRERAVALGSGTHLVVDASPACHFCPLAAAAIERDPTLAALFHDALWIVRPESEFGHDFYAHWNDVHPAERMVVVFDARGWELPDDWVTPVFRFFRDGHVVATVSGWTKDSPAALLATGRRLGLGS